MRKRERKERGEILNEDGREIRWMKEIWKRKERTEKERGGGQEQKCYFLELWFLCFLLCNQKSESP
jgi:hypothetical protein